jgi:hypothetical protein
MALTGTTTNRAVEFEATVDGNEAAGLGVMSQGEVNALALSVFLPRATSPDSPLRFVVIDDPVQAMDPSEVDGKARVLTDVAASRQVDAMRLEVGEEIPAPVTARVVPGLCRSATEETWYEITRQRRLARGDKHSPVEEALAATTTTMTKLALALFDAGRRGEVYDWLNRNIGQWGPNLVKEVNNGAHESVSNPRGLVEDSRRLVQRLREKLP